MRKRLHFRSYRFHEYLIFFSISYVYKFSPNYPNGFRAVRKFSGKNHKFGRLNKPQILNLWVATSFRIGQVKSLNLIVEILHIIPQSFISDFDSYRTI